jgi:Integral membrane protein S linking to the trans Golgi network
MARGGSASPQGSGGTFYGREAFNPGRIIGQVIAIQLVLYVSDAWLLLAFDYLLGVRLGSDDGRLSVLFRQMFDHRIPSLYTASGIVSIASFYIAMIGFCSATFSLVVGRSKRALDFTTTIVVTHFVCCTVVTGLPTSSLWWFTVCSAAVGMTIASEILSRRQEMRAIAVPTRDVESVLPDDDDDDIRPA